MKQDSVYTTVADCSYIHARSTTKKMECAFCDISVSWEVILLKGCAMVG